MLVAFEGCHFRWKSPPQVRETETSELQEGTKESNLILMWGVIDLPTRQVSLKKNSQKKIKSVARPGSRFEGSCKTNISAAIPLTALSLFLSLRISISSDLSLEAPTLSNASLRGRLKTPFMAQTEIFLSTGLLVDLAMVKRMGATLGLWVSQVWSLTQKYSVSF